TATTLAVCGFSFAVSGTMMPPIRCSCSSTRLTRMRSLNGRTFIGVSSLFAVAGHFASDRPHGSRSDATDRDREPSGGGAEPPCRDLRSYLRDARYVVKYHECIVINLFA